MNQGFVKSLSKISSNNNVTTNSSLSTSIPTTTTTTTSISTNTVTNNGNACKIDPRIVKKAEHLLGKASLDNPDVTITSLNYIDDYQSSITAGLNNGRSTCIRTIQGYFDRKNSIKSPEFK